MPYTPSEHVLINKPIGFAQSIPSDARSYFYDTLLYKYRPYQSIAEVLSYLDTPNKRSGHFDIFINSGTLDEGGIFSGGTVTKYWFKDGVADVDLVEAEAVTEGGPVSSVNGQTGAVVLDKTHIGLPNVDNTSDANKPISTAVQDALNLKSNATDTLDTLTDAVTVSWNYATQSTDAKVVLSGDRTLSITNLPSNKVVYLTLEVIQDGVGGRSLTLPTGTKVVGSNGISLTVTPNAIDIISFRWNGAILFASYGLNYS